ncbi:MAG: glycosyltransferase family 39 protein, partial [Anaerolineae bacterium]
MKQPLLSRYLSNKESALFWAFVGFHTLIWTLLPSIYHPNAPLDTIELVAWGHEWQWGYKHPPLAAWLSELAIQFGGRKLWSIFLLSQISVVSALWAMWILAKQFLPKEHALLSVLLLEGVYYYNVTSPEFNANVLQLPLWAFTSLLFWLAVQRGSLPYWALFGLLAGLCLLAKYYAAFLVCAMAILLVLTPEGRAQWRKPGLYLASGVCIVTVAPHILWLIRSEFLTITYALGRSRAENGAWAHIMYPIAFFLAQTLANGGAVLLHLALAARNTVGRTYRPSLSFEGAFPWVVGLGPFLVTILVSAVFGLRLRSMWGTPLWNFTGLMLLLGWTVGINQQALRRFTFAWILIVGIGACGYVGAVQRLALFPRAHFPGELLGTSITDKWHGMYDDTLRIVGGRTWVAGNIAFYSKDRPSVFVGLESRESPWVNDADVRKHGAVLVWEIRKGGEAMPAGWLSRFPDAITQPPLTFPWHGHADVAPLKVGWAVVPPPDRGGGQSARPAGWLGVNR